MTRNENASNESLLSCRDGIHNGDRIRGLLRRHARNSVIIVIIAIKRCRDERGLHAGPVSWNAFSYT